MCRSLAKIHLPQSLYTDCISLKYSCGLTVPHFRHVTNTTHVSIFFLRNVFSVKTEMHFLEKWITFWYRAHLIGESKMFHACNFNEKKDYPRVIIRLWWLWLSPKIHHLVALNLNYQNPINPSLEDLQWFQGHVQYVGFTVIPCTLNYQLMFILIWRLVWGAEVLFSKNRKKMIRLMYTFCTWRGLT